jgi:hypothetical protein
VFLTNNQGGAHIRQQILGNIPEDAYRVNWNFHVIFIEKDGNQAKVYDFESRLPWGANFKDVWTKAL